MRDFPQYTGKMCDWPEVAAMPGAQEVLEILSRRSRLYVASGATDSAAGDIRRALARAGLDRYITDCFCRHNTGYRKPDLRFYQAILDILGVASQDVTMVGDSLANDILPCRQLGIQTILLAATAPSPPLQGILVVRTLAELC